MKKLISCLSGLLVVALSGCTNVSPSSKPISNNGSNPVSKSLSLVKPGEVIDLSKFSPNSSNTSTVFIGDAGNGKKGADISITFNFQNFNTKTTANGIPPKRVSDIATAKLYLTTSNTDPLNTASLVFTSGSLAYSGTAKTYTFANVPTGGPYFVAVELFDSTPANIIQPIAYGGTTGTIGLTVSGAPTPSVTVDANAIVSTNSALTVNPILKAGTGASIDTTVTPVDGTFTGSISAS